MSDEVVCPRCKTTNYRNPKLQLLVNSCGHSLCQECVESLFNRASGTCPQCGVNLRKNTFRPRQFESDYVEKEVDIRKRILKDYNLHEDNFKSLIEYNDYLEEIERIVYNLANNVDLQTTNKKIEAFKKENKELIQKNKFRLSDDQKYIQRYLQEEKIQEELRKAELAEIHQIEVVDKQKEKETIINELSYSADSASKILAQRRLKKAGLMSFSSQEAGGPEKSMSPAVDKLRQQLEAPLYEYVPFKHAVECPIMPPSPNTVYTEGYTDGYIELEEQTRHTGYQPTYACQKWLLSFFSGLFLEPPSSTSN